MKFGPAEGTDVTDLNTELGQRIGENWAVTSDLGKTRDHSIFMLRPPDAARTLLANSWSVNSLVYSADEWRSETTWRIVSTNPSNPATTGGI
jgi:hypothetical protein